MEEFGDLDIAGYTRAMADSLAMMHCLAKVDANDVEFVLAPPRPGDLLEATFTSVTLEQHALWILDFDCCNSMPMNETGVNQAVAAFFKYDPFYPLPGIEDTHDQEMWEMFRARFLETSLNIFRDDDYLAHLPRQLMDKVEEEGAARRARQKACDEREAPDLFLLPFDRLHFGSLVLQAAEGTEKRAARLRLIKVQSKRVLSNSGVVVVTNYQKSTI